MGNKENKVERDERGMRERTWLIIFQKKKFAHLIFANKQSICRDHQCSANEILYKGDLGEYI